MSVCHYCRAELDPDDPSVYHRVVGWERRALKGSSRRGGSDVTLRERMRTYACDGCVRKLKRRVAVGQEALNV